MTKRNVDDVDYVSTTETRPMREVLAERKRKARGLDKKTLADAHRKRAGMIGMLQSCLCCYPLVESDTESKHETWCPSTALFESMRRSQ